ncbi:TPA: Dynein assembly factor with WDR repeat domains 1 [Trebouxia sp. C0006]
MLQHCRGEDSAANGHKSLVTAVDCSGDGQLVASASGDGCCCVWDLAEGTLKHKLQADSGGSSPSVGLSNKRTQMDRW